MPTITLRIPDELLETASRFAKSRHMPRSEYIRRAIERMNRESETELRRQRMALASRKVRESSMEVNAEFDAIEHGDT
jgi:metal-responsive CopG/Arc/MetJ family transcriptional regulator